MEAKKHQDAEHETAKKAVATCGCSCCHEHESEAVESAHEHSHDAGTSGFRLFVPAIVSFILLVVGMLLQHWVRPSWFGGWTMLVWYLVAYLPVGWPVLRAAWSNILAGQVFSEFLLMAIATIGAFAIGEYPEGVAVMLFYTVGETFQGMAVARARRNIKSMLDQRPDEVTVLTDGTPQRIKAQAVQVGQTMLIKPGEKVALDGELCSPQASFNTAALTGESKPDTKYNGERVLAGMINLQSACQVRVTATYQDSKLSRILTLVQEATAQKSPTELFIRKFARIYTPIVVLLAVCITLLPAIWASPYIFSEWLSRALVFLVISCPCALVVSIPLGYFGGIGAGSRYGLLFKGNNYLDAIAGITDVVVDKTGTITRGVFTVQRVVWVQPVDEARMLMRVARLEQHSTHPVATAVGAYVDASVGDMLASQIKELPGHGLYGRIDETDMAVGNFRLLDHLGISYQKPASDGAETLVTIACDGVYVGYLAISDEVKDDAAEAVAMLHRLHIRTTMLSGDKAEVVQAVARRVNIDRAVGELLPEDKVNEVKALKAEGRKVAFVGDGVNDAPVVALSHVGMAMGGLGSDATIETADVVIQDDQVTKIPLAIKIGRATKRIVWQNIVFALGIKLLVLLMGAFGVATMWEAVFADVGVALLAILNAVRILYMRFVK